MKFFTLSYPCASENNQTERAIAELRQASLWRTFSSDPSWNYVKLNVTYLIIERKLADEKNKAPTKWIRKEEEKNKPPHKKGTTTMTWYENNFRPGANQQNKKRTREFENHRSGESANKRGSAREGKERKVMRSG